MLSPVSRTTLAVAAAGGALALLTGCSSSSSTAAPTVTTTTTETTTASPTSSPTSSPTQTGSGAECTESSILAALPAGSAMQKYQCADVAGTKWAAAAVTPGPTVFFLQDKGGTWDVSTADEVCGTASAGLPPVILAFCPKT